MTSSTPPLPSLIAEGVASVVDCQSPVAAKIGLFRSLFRGREDVYPRRFESLKTRRSGYQPACGNEWARGLCEKPRIKCAECANRRFLHVTDQVVRWHLSGRDDQGRDFVMGVYPMLLDETCFFLAVDFDDEGWREDAGAFLATCWHFQVPAALERSRSGEGGHVWLFFTEAVPARLARNLGSYLLTEAMEQRPDIGFRSYDRFFPNQDTLPKGGLGNLIALPLQKQARARDNSLFLDETLAPYPDQWAFLASVRKLPPGQAETLVNDAERRGRVLGVHPLPSEEDEMPWTAPPSRRRKEPPIAGPLPSRLELVLADQVYVAKDGLPAPLRNRLLRLAAFPNPEFYKAQAMRLPTYNRPRIVACAEDLPLHVALPRGCLEETQVLLRSLRIEPVVRDERFGGTPFVAAFRGELRPEQGQAAQALLAHETGVLAATTAFGKTVVGAWLIARRGVNTLVLVHRRQLLEQWVERLSTFLGVPANDIGQLGAGHKKLTGRLDVALIQSLVRKEVVDDRVGDYGHLVVDECHHLSARSFELVARRAKAKFILGLSATVIRKDGHHPIIFMQCGPVRYRVDARRQAAARPFAHRVMVRPTGFRAELDVDQDARVQIAGLYTALAADEARNRLICGDVVRVVREGRSPLVLTERTEHLERLATVLAGEGCGILTLRGGMNKGEWETMQTRLAEAPTEPGRVLIATGAFIGEGFDDARLDTLFLALPVSWRGTIAQYLGRLHRLFAGKREVRVYDYADLDVPMLARMFERRCWSYEANCYTILLPASAVSGWPSEVPLPADLEWKQSYAASVRRLIQDGVDVVLGDLFVRAAQPKPAAPEGVDRARSATEAFLFRRLESLPETAGRFRLNSALPIAFDDCGTMEVDLLCVEAHLAVELDGPQHLSDPEAYRRDRRKDALLQEHGFCVLRFLAEDATTRLSEVLDSILRTLARLGRAKSL